VIIVLWYWRGKHPYSGRRTGTTAHCSVNERSGHRGQADGECAPIQVGQSGKSLPRREGFRLRASGCERGACDTAIAWFPRVTEKLCLSLPNMNFY
jgi:hypothetical protein